MILILNGPIITQSTTPPGPETLTGGAVMYEGKLCWSPFTAFKAISRSNNHTCAEGFELTHLNYVETVETVRRGKKVNGTEAEQGWRDEKTVEWVHAGMHGLRERWLNE